MKDLQHIYPAKPNGYRVVLSVAGTRYEKFFNNLDEAITFRDSLILERKTMELKIDSLKSDLTETFIHRFKPAPRDNRSDFRQLRSLIVNGLVASINEELTRVSDYELGKISAAISDCVSLSNTGELTWKGHRLNTLDERSPLRKTTVYKLLDCRLRRFNVAHNNTIKPLDRTTGNDKEVCIFLESLL